MLTLVATPIGNVGDMSPRAIEALQASKLICCEDTRHSGSLLARLGVSGVPLAVCNEHNEAERAAEVIARLAAGEQVAVITDAGTPGISDPGAQLVRAVLDAGYLVSAIPGPAALIMALVISGMDTTRFVFDGFLPRSGGARSERLAEIAAERRTTVLYEAPHRVARTVTDLAEVCGGQRQVAVCRELTKLYEDVWRGPLGEAAAQVANPRGEYVLVLEGATPPPAATDDDLLAALRQAIAAGQDRKTAIATVTATLGVPKKRVYALALTLPKP